MSRSLVCAPLQVRVLYLSPAILTLVGDIFYQHAVSAILDNVISDSILAHAYQQEDDGINRYQIRKARTSAVQANVINNGIVVVAAWPSLLIINGSTSTTAFCRTPLLYEGK